MSTDSINISSREDIKELIQKIGLKEMKLSGRGYQNRERGIYGIMLFPEEDQSKVIDIFISESETDKTRYMIGGNSKTEDSEE